MDTSTELFDSYEQDFKQIISSIRDKLEGEGKNEVGGAPHYHLYRLDAHIRPEQRKAALRRVEMELDEEDEMVSLHPSVS